MLQQLLQRTPLLNVKFYFSCSGLRGFGVPDHVRSSVSGHCLKHMFQPLLQITLQKPQNYILIREVRNVAAFQQFSQKGILNRNTIG